MTLNIPVALTIAGSDSGGGAGIQADLKTFAALGVHGASAISCLTAQNPSRVSAIQECTPQMLRRQLQAVFDGMAPAAVKTGMLLSSGNIRVVAAFLKDKKIPLVVDPVMIATSGTKLLRPTGLRMLMARLLPLATLVTPNLGEAEILAGRAISSIAEMDAAAREIHNQFGCAVLVKGGHLPTEAEATDIFFDGHRPMALSAPFIKGIRTHGTGCVYSAAICAALALGKNLPDAVKAGKKFVSRAIRNSVQIGNHFALGF